ncbi:MAG: hypothetical protein ABJ360_06995 [Roseobacter sp.]
MRFVWTFLVFLNTQAALACEQPVCLVDPDALALRKIITFEETRSSPGPGHLISNLLVLDGAVFGERFAGQSIQPVGDHDDVAGDALFPLTLMPGDRGQNLSVVQFKGNNVLNGYGHAGFPKRRAQGEGAISFLFDEDQSALSFQLRGGESGAAKAAFLSRDGRVIALLDLPAAGEYHYGFIRANGAADIAGVVVTNRDPAGVAMDNVRFGTPPDLS